MSRDLDWQIKTIKFLVVSVAFLSIIQILLYWVVGLMASADGSMPVPQHDSLLYCQAARRIVEGHPFSYSCGEQVSTGTTSVLYPFVLALPYAIGLKGGALLTAGFWLNAFLYLVFVGGWAAVFCKWTKDWQLRLFAGVLLALSCQPAACALMQSDTGLMMAASALLMAAFAFNRIWLSGLVLVVLPWVRPEGMMCVLAMFALLVIETWWFRKSAVSRSRRSDWVFVVLAILSVGGVFALNYGLTGRLQFSSVANKGHFVGNPFSTAVVLSAFDFCRIARNYFCGLGSGSFHELFVIPLFGGILFLGGLLSSFGRNAEKTGNWRSLGLMALASALSFLSVATSGWQGTNFDRYLAWCQPPILFFTAAGALAFARRLGALSQWLVAGGVVAYSLGAALTMACIFYDNSRIADRRLQFARLVNGLIPAEASVGGPSCNMAYQLGNRRFFHFSGLYSPDFMCPGRPDAAEVVEKLRHRPELRPDYLILNNPEDFFGFTREQVDKLGLQVLSGPSGSELRRSDWQLFEASNLPSVVPVGKVLVAGLDVGYEADERHYGFAVTDRWNRRPGAPFIHIGKLAGREIIECGRVVEGVAEMVVPLVPRKPVALVVRVAKRENARYLGPYDVERTEFQLGDKLSFVLTLDGQELRREVSVPEVEKDDFVEFALEIPGELVNGPLTRFSIGGDHIACAYRFYQ